MSHRSICVAPTLEVFRGQDVQAWRLVRPVAHDATGLLTSYAEPSLLAGRQIS
jgi:hypothetical protein